MTGGENAGAARAGALGPDEELRRLRLLLDRLPAMIGYWDSDLRNVIANDAYVDYFGMAPEEMRGRHIRDVLGAAVYALNLPYIAGALAGEEQLFERTLTDRHGTLRYTQASYVPDIVDGQVQGFYVQVTDVTERVQAQHERDEALRLFQISMANAPFGKAVLDRSAITLQVNPALCALLGYEAEELIGNDFRDIVHPDDRPAADTDLAQLQGEAAAPLVASERRYVRRDGSTIWLQRTAVLVTGVHGGDDVLVAQFQDITARRDAEAELARLALTDPLTGLHNRHALTERMLQLRQANPISTVGTVFVDLDGFKHINDTHGHSAGDAVLIQAAGLITQVVPPTCSAYRLGGDEFVVLVPEPATGTEVAELADAIRATLTGVYPTKTRSVTLAATVGWTWGATNDAEELLEQADADMYRQKPRLRRSGDRVSRPEGEGVPRSMTGGG